MKLKEEVRWRNYLVFILLILLPLLVTATYTWFSLSRTPKVSEMGLSISSNTGLVLAFLPNESEWTQHLDFRTQKDEMIELKPVTWSDANHCFYAAQFGADGRITGITERLSDEANTNTTNTRNSYYLKKTCYARSDENVTVSLSPAVTGADGRQGAGTYVIGTPIWNSETIQHNDGGNGAQHAIRVGFMLTKFDAKTDMRKDETVFYIYEPNSEKHVDGEEIEESTPSIDGTEELVPKSRLIRQTTSQWSEANPVERDVVIRQLGEFTTQSYLFDLMKDEYIKIDIYVWLEGQDTDCTNKIGDKAQIFVNIQFSAENDLQSGLEKIE